MRNKMIIGVLGTVSILAGWTAVSLDFSDASAFEDKWPLESNLTADGNNQHYSAMLKNIENSNMFPRPKGSESRQGGGNGSGDSALDVLDPNYVPPFPEIVSVAIVDRIGRVVLREDDDVVIHAKEGDIVGSDWLVKTIELTSVTAVFDGKERTFKINYTNNTETSDFEKSSEDL